MAIDVTSLANRRATERWNRVAVGDLLERVTYSDPDRDALVGWPGAFAYPEYARVSYRRANGRRQGAQARAARRARRTPVTSGAMGQRQVPG
jgi:hypothetical protein